MKPPRFSTLGLLAAAAMLAACGPEDGSLGAAATPARTSAARPTVPIARTAAPAPAPRGDVGTVTAVVPLRTSEAPSGAGALIGGAAAGHQIEKDRKTRVTGYRIDILLGDGRNTSVTLAQPGLLATGQRVRVVDGSIRPA